MKTLTTKVDLFALCEHIKATTGLSATFTYFGATNSVLFTVWSHDNKSIYGENISVNASSNELDTLMSDIKALQQQFKHQEAA